MSTVDTPTVVLLLREYAQRTALRGGNPYRAKAYSRAADSLATLALPLDVLIAEGRLTEIPGVGDAIAHIITKLHRTGSHPSLEKLRKEIPASVLEMLTVPGLRPEKILRLYKDLGITSLAELEAAAKEDRIRKTKGLGTARCRPRFSRTLPSRGGAKAGFTCTALRPYWSTRWNRSGARCPNSSA
jgi:DNA polymerase (family 10)